MSSAREIQWKSGGAPTEGLSEALRVLSAERASVAELARLERALAAQLAAPTRSAGAGRSGAGSWLSFGRAWPWISVVLLGLAASWQLLSRHEVEPSPAVALAPPPTESPLPTDSAAPSALPPAVVPEPEPIVPVAKASGKRPARAARAVSSGPGSVEAELALLREAQRALNRSASAALSLADQHARLYPNGLFAQEREMLRIEAELTLGRRREALDRAHAFAERFGSSTYRARIDRLLAAHRALKDREPREAQRTH